MKECHVCGDKVRGRFPLHDWRGRPEHPWCATPVCYDLATSKIRPTGGWPSPIVDEDHQEGADGPFAEDDGDGEDVEDQGSNPPTW